MKGVPYPRGVIGNSLCLRIGEFDVKLRTTNKMNDKEKSGDFTFGNLLSENVVNWKQTFESQNQLLLVEDVMNEKTCKKMAKQLNKLRYKRLFTRFVECDVNRPLDTKVA